MNESQIEVIFQKLLGLGCRPPKQMSTPQGFRFAVQTWAEVLADVRADDMANAVLRYSRSSESAWWPTPGVLLALIAETERDPQDNGDEMWGTLLTSVAARGRDRPPTSDDPIHENPEINAKIVAGIEACGGWRNLCMSTHYENMANRAAFRSAYQAKGQVMETQKQLIATRRLLSTSARTAIPQEDITKEQ